MTRSTGTSGSTIAGGLANRCVAERIAARSTSSGTPVKSCSRMRETTNGISVLRSACGCHAARARTSFSATRTPSQ
jgi:hypothetical protein